MSVCEFVCDFVCELLNLEVIEMLTHLKIMYIYQPQKAFFHRNRKGFALFNNKVQGVHKIS